MKKILDDSRLMLKCCTLYYENELGQNEIAQKLNISRPTVSRFLKQAKEQGIIRIQINNPLEKEGYLLERKLEEKFNLKEAIVIEDQYYYQNELNNIGEEVSKYLYRTLKEGDRVGISMGQALSNIPKFAEYKEFKNIEFIPLVGGVTQSDTQRHSNQLVIEFSRNYGGQYRLLHAPAIVSDINIKDNLIKDNNIGNTFSLMDKLNVAIVGIGNPLASNSTLIKSGYITNKDKETFIKENAIGDICLQVYNIEGHSSNYKYNKFVFGMDIEKLRSVNTVIGVACGIEKISAIKGALNGKFINVLATNYEVAQKLLDSN